MRSNPIMIAILLNNPKLDKIRHSIVNNRIVDSFAQFDRTARARAVALLTQQTERVYHDSLGIAFPYLVIQLLETIDENNRAINTLQAKIEEHDCPIESIMGAVSAYVSVRPLDESEASSAVRF
jgi:hypothetical protein